MKPRHWLTLGGMLSFAIVAGTFLVIFPPVETVSRYDQDIKTMRFWRVNNWWGTYTEIFPAHHYEQDDTEEKTTSENADPGIFGEPKDSQPGTDLSGMTDPFTGETISPDEDRDVDPFTEDPQGDGVLPEGYVPDLEDQSSGG